MTKAVEADVLERHMKALGFEYRGGRHELTPEYDGLVDGTPTGEDEEVCSAKQPDPDPDAEDRADHIHSIRRNDLPTPGYQPIPKNPVRRSTAIYSQDTHLGVANPRTDQQLSTPMLKDHRGKVANIILPGRVKAQSARS